MNAERRLKPSERRGPWSLFSSPLHRCPRELWRLAALRLQLQTSCTDLAWISLPQCAKRSDKRDEESAGRAATGWTESTLRDRAKSVGRASSSPFSLSLAISLSLSLFLFVSPPPRPRFFSMNTRNASPSASPLRGGWHSRKRTRTNSNSR